MSPSGERFSFDSAGLTLTGERFEPDDGVGPRGVPAVVLLHGGGQTRHSWGRTAGSLAAAGRTAIVLDARGHGDSDWDPGQSYGLDSFVDDLLGFVSTLERPPVLVGASLGGITAMMAAGEHPGLASGLVLVDVVVDIERAGVRRIVEFMNSHLDGFATLDEVADAIVAYNPVRKRPRNLEGLRKNVRLRADGRWYWHWDPAFIRIDDEPQRRIERARLRNAAQRLTIPVLIVRGRQSDVVSDKGLADMLELVPHAQVVDVGAAGHMVAGDDNDVFAAQLEEFVHSIDPKTDGG